MSASDKRKRRLRLCFVGWGAIASRVGELLAERQPAGVEIVAVAVRDPELERPGLPASARLITGPHELAGLDIDMVIEVAGRPAVAIWGEAALRHASSFVVSSASAFTDDALLGLLLAVAEKTGSRIVVPRARSATLARSLLPRRCRWTRSGTRSSSRRLPGRARGPPR